MPKYFAFLRAVNVGGRNVTMERLRLLFEGWGFSDVKTFIASGNVLLSAPGAEPDEIETLIEAELQKALGYRVDTFLRSPEDLVRIASHRPFGQDDPGPGHALHVGFLKSPPGTERLKGLERYRDEVDDFQTVGREFFWLCRGRVSDSDFSGSVLEKLIGAPATFRNVTTVRKMAAFPRST
ncbi:MAG: DUF1697 domain-containing protein [Isosphaeraceae bacterium]